VNSDGNPYFKSDTGKKFFFFSINSCKANIRPDSKYALSFKVRGLGPLTGFEKLDHKPVYLLVS